MNQPSNSHLKNRPSPIIEDYLAIILEMKRDKGEVLAVRLAESLDVAPPTVSVTLKRMERDGWIATDPTTGINLTKTGRTAANSIIRRHMLTEWMLTRMLNIPWSRIHAEADQIEHTISEEIEAQMRTNLNDPQLCPHGNPFPGYEHMAADWFPLTSMITGEKVIIRRIHETAEDNPELLQFLETNGVVPGTLAEVIGVLSFNQTISLKLDKKKVTLGFATAKYIDVEKTT
jgi:DtxR family transcriptional regulator, Mn-dependent transcriptional regulator